MSVQIPGVYKIRHIGNATLGSAGVCPLPLWLAAGQSTATNAAPPLQIIHLQGLRCRCSVSSWQPALYYIVAAESHRQPPPPSDPDCNQFWKFWWAGSWQPSSAVTLCWQWTPAEAQPDLEAQKTAGRMQAGTSDAAALVDFRLCSDVAWAESDVVSILAVWPLEGQQPQPETGGSASNLQVCHIAPFLPLLSKVMASSLAAIGLAVVAALRLAMQASRLRSSS